MILITTTIAAFMGTFDQNIVNIALPSIGGSLHTQLSYLIWIPTAYLAVSASLQATMGWLGDIVGRKRVFMIGVFLFTMGSALASMSSNIFILILNRVMQGAGVASMGASSIAIVTDTFGSDRGKAIGINLSATYTGLTLGPLAGGFLVQTLGWRSIFYVNIPVGIVVLILSVFYLPRIKVAKEEGKRAFDITGSTAFSLFIISLMFVLSQAYLALPEIEFLVIATTCAVSFSTFLLNESRFAKKPIIDLKLFTRNRLFSAANATAVFNYVTFGGTVFVLPIYLQLVLGFSPLSSGLIVSVQSIFQALTAPVAGRLSDRISARVLSSTGMAIRSIGLFALSFLTVSSQPQNVWIPLTLIGLGHGLFSPPNTNSLMSSVERGKRGVASGILGTVRVGSISAGTVVMGAIVAALMPAGEFGNMSSGGGVVPTSIAGSFVIGLHYAFLFAAAFSAIGILTSLVRGKESRLEATV